MVSTACSNDQYASGTLDNHGNLATQGEGGPFGPFTTAGDVLPDSCETLQLHYTAQTPPGAGPVEYTCNFARVPGCAPTLLETLTGKWSASCGSSTCVTTFTAAGVMTSTCSSGQTSTGAIDESGAFADMGSAGGFQPYSTKGVVALNDCNSFSMHYTFQIPPNQGSKTPAKCAYTRQME